MRRVDRGGGRAVALGVPRRLQRAELPHLGGRDGQLAAAAAPTRPRVGPAGAAGGRATAARGVRVDRARGAPTAARHHLERRASAPRGRHPALRRRRSRRRSGSAGGVSVPPGRAAAAGPWRSRQYSDELLPRPVALSAHEARAARPRGAARPRETGSGSSGSASPRSPANGSRAGGWGCARRVLDCGMANGRLTDRKDEPLDPHQAHRA